MISLTFVLLLLAFIFFVLAVLPIPQPMNFVALGLALWVLTLLIPR